MMFVDCDPNDDMLKEYLKFFKQWKQEFWDNGIWKIDLTLGAVKAMQRRFFGLVKGYKNKTFKKTGTW